MGRLPSLYGRQAIRETAPADRAIAIRRQGEIPLCGLGTRCVGRGDISLCQR